MKLHIKNMVCERCVLAIEQLMQELGYHPLLVIMGEVELREDSLAEQEIEQIKQAIEALGFELLGNKKQAQIEQIKTSLIQLIHTDQELQRLKLSDYLTTATGQDYQSLSQLFSSCEGLTIEKYFIQLKIERIKELLVYDELSLTEISYRLGYSSLAHLSSQFKQITGINPSTFKRLKDNRQRHPLDKIKPTP